MKRRVAVLVSGGGTNLQALLDAGNRGEMPHAEIALVLSSRKGAYALERAIAAKVPAEVVERREYSVAKEFDRTLLKKLKEYRIEVVILAGFLCILGEDILSAYPDKIVNVHPSLIPSFCGDGFYGLRVHKEALQRGVKVTGATVHLVNEITDGGRILLQKAVPVMEDDTPQSLQRRVMEQAEWELLPRAVEMLCAEK